MPRFEVYVPPAPPKLPVAVTLRVESENWLAALKVGLQKVGGGELAANILCDIQSDGSIHVTDPAGARVFRIRELPAAAPARPVAPPPADPNATAVMHPPVELIPPAPPRAPAPAPAPAPARAPAPAPARAPARASAPPAAAPPVVARHPPDSHASRVEEVAAPSEPQPVRIGRIGEPRPPAEAGPMDVLADVFFRSSQLNTFRERDRGLAFLLDLAMEKIRCDAGSVLIGRFQTGDLAFAVARGPKGDEIVRRGLAIPWGKGIVGFCAQENVCLAVSDTEKDPRFYRDVSEAVGYATRSALCAPIAWGGRVRGAMELLNKGAGAFDPADLAILSFLAHKAGELLERVE
jgi:hypothetical protein